MIIRADARALPLIDGCVQCCITSPPYFGLRDYGNPAQIGLEATPDAYIATLVAVFRDVRRVLKDDGTCWVNMGDSYNSSTQNNHGKGGALAHRHLAPIDGWAGHRPMIAGLKPKDLIGIPWLLAFALRADGWYLRADIIWAKPNPMPESVTDRPTKSHEYLFLLSKQASYYYDADAIAEVVTGGTHGGANRPTTLVGYGAVSQHGGKLSSTIGLNPKQSTRNKRSVWTVPTMPYSGAHFATFPEALVEPCILAGSRLGDRVLDPFLGSGTVGAVAERLGRRWVGTDLSYQPLSKTRTRQRGIPFGEATA